MRRAGIAIAALAIVAVMLAGCSANGSGQPAGDGDLRGEILSVAAPISWEELMAGAPTEKVLKVTGIVGEEAIGDSGIGLLSVEGDPNHLLSFKLAPAYEDAGVISMDDIRPGEVTLYGTASGEAGIITGGGPDMVRMFYVGVVVPAEGP